MAGSSVFTPFMKQCFVTAAVCSNILGHACYIGFPGVLLPQLAQPGSLIPLTKEQASWLSSIVAFAMLCGNFITPMLMDRIGRRATHLAVTAPAIIGWYTNVLATSYQALIIGRILGGVSFGMQLPLRSALIGEYTSPKNRGAFLTTISLSQASGIFLVHLLGSLLSWQTTSLICAFFPFTSFIMTMYSPESPSYLATKGNYDECRTVFRWLRGDGEEAELEALIQARQDFKEHKIRNLKDLKQTVKKKEFCKPILLMVHAQAMMQFAGGTTMSAYSTVIIGLIAGSVDVHFWMIALDGQRIISNALAIYAINRYKRRTMMISIASLCILSHVAISVYVYAKSNGHFTSNAVWIPLLLINIQIFTVATGMVPLPNVIAGEVFPLQYRSVGGSISLASASLFTFIVLKSFPSLVDNIGIQGTYMLYAIAMSFFLIVIWFLLPETKGKTLLQIEDEFRGMPLKPHEVEAREALQKDTRKMSMISMLSKRSIVLEM